MPCKHIDLPGGGSAIVCSRETRMRRCSVCKRSTRDYRLCDYPIAGERTCDRVLCAACAAHVEPDTDYCPDHAALLASGGRLKL
jgi:hypothetical protein